MADESFAPLLRTARRRARLERWQRVLLRPLRPTRLVPDRPGPPNLLLVGVDTLRADHTGFGGCPLPTTPHLDRLAARGTVFSDVTAPAPWTLPSFAGALSGLMPGLHGAYLPGPERNMDTQPPQRLQDGTRTLAAHLAARGYRTAAFYSNQFFAFGLAETFAEHRYLNLPAGDLAEAALDWIRRHGDRPFFCFVLFNDPHEPTTPPATDLAPFLPDLRRAGADVSPAALAGLARWGEPPTPHLGRVPLPLDPVAAAALALKKAIYAATVRQVDRAIGSMQDKLEAWRLADRTVVSVFSDHGEEFLDHAAEGHRWGHDPRGLVGIGHGHSHFQELLHVPWATWGPGVPRGRRVTAPVSLLDLAPTLADWVQAGPLTPGQGRPLPAGALARSLVGRSRADGADQDAGTTPLLAEAIAYGPDLVMVRRGRWKLIARRDGEPLALYDLGADPGEHHDCRDERPQELAQLRQVVEAWRASGCGAAGGGGGGGWADLDATVRQRLKDLGYAE
ncbi:MAG: sulfatase [Candidatus Krumholzibacteriia bacterium]